MHNIPVFVLALSHPTLPTTQKYQHAIVFSMNCQFEINNVKSINLAKAKKMMLKCISDGAELIVLPESFNSPYGIEYFKEYSEELKDGHFTYDFLKNFTIENTDA